MSELVRIAFVLLFCLFFFAAMFATSGVMRAVYLIGAGVAVATLIRGLMS